jgi:hypothetical protein
MIRRLPTVLCLAASLLYACAPGDDDDSDGDAGIVDLDDADGDTIADEHEGRGSDVDTDGDGTPDWEDLDSDGDGIPDYREAGDDKTGTPPVDSDGDGTPDFRDLDSDDNGRADGVDGVDDLDGDGIGNFADLDDDGDGILDVAEIGPSPDMPLDSDSDGMPDFQDFDSDNDTIKDLHEGIVDLDMDGTPSYLDLDSDGDCIPDALEAGDADLDTPPVDTDGDAKPDFLDLDSDNDGLADSQEDLNCNGSVDPGESSATNPDTDGDGVSDLVEVAAGTDPTDPADNPTANGDFVFEVPYMEPPNPLDDTLDFATNISQADVVFGMDTTGSMGGEIANLKSSVVSLINTIRSTVPNAGFAVVGYDDFPISPYGSAASGDQPFLLLHRAMSTNTAAGLTSVQSRVNALATHFGADGPESGWELVYQTATGLGTSAGGASVPAFNPATAFPSAPPAGETVGDIGGVGFRTGSLPILVWITDAPSHNSDITGNNYAGFTAARTSDAMTAFGALSGRVIGVVSSVGDGDGRPDVLHAVNTTGSLVPPAAWGPVGTRPGSCALTQCCTGLSGAGEAPAGGMCPLIFRINGDGTGLGNAVAKAVEVLTGFATIDIGADPQDDPSDSVDAVAEFVDRIEANPTAPAPCASGLTAIDVAPVDGIPDTFDDVTPGTTVCFDVIPKMNTTVMPLSTPQMFMATIVVQGDGVTTLDTRDIFFLVPPEIPDVPID